MRSSISKLAYRSLSRSSATLRTRDFHAARYLSSSSSQQEHETYSNEFVMKPPEELTADIAEGISDATKFYVKYGMANQRLLVLQKDETVPVVEKWQKMMEIFLAAQVHVIAGLGYAPNEQGLTQYAKDLAKCLESVDPTMQELFSDTRRETWRELVATAFGLDKADIPTVDIVKAREIMHQVSSKMMAPDTLLEIQSRTSGISGTH